MKSQILANAREAFGSHGYAETSLRQIAEKVGIKTPSLYAHFPNKSALYEAVYNEVASEHSEFFGGLVDETSDLTPLERLHALLSGIETYYRVRPDLADFSLRAAVAESHPSGHGLRRIFLDSESSLIFAVQQSFDDGVASRQFAPGDTEEFSALFLMLMDGLFLQLTHYEPAVFRQRFELAWRQLSRMLVTTTWGEDHGDE